jgi:PAT family beta-lactamase induction signal transducer AmpG
MTSETEANVELPKKTGVLGALLVYLERRSLVMLALGFASGLPNLLIFDTLSAWLRDAGLSLEVIGFFSLATLAYSLKFIWAPLVDRTTIPGLTQILGHRRSWMITMQLLVMLGLWLIAGVDPAQDLGKMAMLAVLVGFTAATQDIVIDAWRIEAVDESRQGAMAAAYQWGYRIAMIVAGAAPLILADTYGWNLSYAVMAALMGIGIAGVLFAPREKVHTVRPIPVGDVPSRPAIEVVEWLARLAIIVVAGLTIGSGLTGKPDLMLSLIGSPAALQPLADAWTADETGVFVQFAAVIAGLLLLVAACWPLPGFKTRPGAYLAGSFGLPLMDFFRRFAGVAGLILALICLYRVSDFVLNIMNPFYLDLGFTKTQVAEVRKVFGVIMSVLGVFLGGLSVARLGLMRSLIIGAFAGPLSNLVFAWLATQGPQLSALFVAIGVDNIASGFAGTCLIAYMSSLTSAGFTATQYALFSSLYALPGKLIASQSGRIVESAARAADGGGFTAGLKSLFTGLPPNALVEGAAKTGVTPAALGSGYVTFFFYSTLIGVAAIVLSFIVAARQPRAVAEAADQAVKQTT